MPFRQCLFSVRAIFIQLLKDRCQCGPDQTTPNDDQENHEPMIPYSLKGRSCYFSESVLDRDRSLGQHARRV